MYIMTVACGVADIAADSEIDGFLIQACSHRQEEYVTPLRKAAEI